jgi:apolipoprotein N-acyltransferase
VFLAASGALGAAAYPDLDWWAAAWVWLVPVLALAVSRSPRQALADGWLQGVVFFLVLLRWLDHTFRHYSAIPWPLTWLPIVALAAYCGLYVGLVAGAVAWLSRRRGAGLALALAPPLWVGGEWIRGHLMGGFPWGLLGYSQHRVLPVLQVAEFTGVYGISFLLCAVNAALAGALALGWRRATPGLAVCALLVGGALGFGWQALDDRAKSAGPAGAEVRVSVIQPSVEQSLKWNPAHHAATMALYERLTREAAGSGPAIILWPETAAAIFLRSDAALLGRLTALSREVRTPILVGSIDRAGGVTGRFRNSAFFLTQQGITAQYDKIHLVPFGEYVPLAWLLGFVRTWAEFISDFEAGREPVVLPLPGAPFGTVICYEVIFPELFREFVGGGALFMANITNDAWFGTTSGPWQHLGMLALRAVENRVAIARAANTGVSAFVEPTGRVAGTLPLLERGVLERTVPLRRRATVYTRFGDWFAYACLGLSAGAMALGAHRRGMASCSAS